MNVHTEHRPSTTGPTRYDEVYYPGHVYGLTHPNHLATIATVYGMQPAPVECCRVLELGCGVGGNLLPMAFQYPDSEFVGVDLSGVTIERGQNNIATLGLNNIKLLHCDIMNVDPSFGQFDYIIAHGVYSWVPPPVREKMMTIFKQNLSPRGICYVSYNAHPFSHLRDMARDMMRYHTRRLTGMKEKVGQARAILKFLSEGSKANTVHGAIMRDQYNRVLKSPDELLFHDDLDDGATAFLLHEVAEDAAQRGLQYLGDSDFSRRYLAGYSEEVRATLQHFPESEFMARLPAHLVLPRQCFPRPADRHRFRQAVPPLEHDQRRRSRSLCDRRFCNGIRDPERQQDYSDQSPPEGSASVPRPGVAARIVIRRVAARCARAAGWPSRRR